MTSPTTDAATRQHLAEHQHFGLREEQLFFFKQGELPCLTSEGKIILSSTSSVATAPDGNGGVYIALQKSGALDDMQKHGIECLDCYCVDNALVRPGDPLFVGHCWARQADCGAKVVAKAYPDEKVGVFANRGGHIEVVEYSEMDPQEAASTDPETGLLRFNWGNICMHYFSVPFLTRMAQQLQQQGRYHIAHKTIPSKDGPVKGVKLELFIFDTFPLAQRAALLEVQREHQFAPVKNAPGTGKDDPDTARGLNLAQHACWVQAAGGFVDDGVAVEVSPLLSYAGEGLEKSCLHQTFTKDTILE